MRVPLRFAAFVAGVAAASWMAARPGGQAVAPAAQPALGTRSAPVVSVDGLRFRDLNKSGALDAYEDWRQPVARRVADLIARMTVAEKVGLMVHASLAGFTGPNGIVLDEPTAGNGPGGMNIPPTPGIEPMDRPAPRVLVTERQVRWILVRPTAGEAPAVTATFSNSIQEMAEGTRLGLPVVFSTDPRHATPRRAGEGQPAPLVISRWPEQVGFAALRDPERVREFGRVARQEYRAVGIHVGLGPMADVASEPRWNRVAGTFGEDPKLAADLVRAYVEGFQGPQLGPDSVLTVTKHFPGDGPVKEGLDPHNDYGRWQVYPGKQLDAHLGPFAAAFAAGTGGIMPGYAIADGIDTVGMAYSKAIVTGLLREKYAFDGVVVTDWLRNMPWGVETLSEKQRQQRIVEMGSDQVGGDNDPKYIRQLAEEGAIPSARLDASARRVLTPMFQLGLFENPYVDPAAASGVVNGPTFAAAGLDAQRRSMVLLKNAGGLLPARGAKRIYVAGIGKALAARYGTVVDDAKQADIAVIEVTAPFALRPNGTGFARAAKEGTLAYAGANNTAELAAIRALAASGTPTVVVMYMDRPAILTEFIDTVPAVLAHFNVSEEAMLDVVFGKAAPQGTLPFDLPRTMASVLAQKEDVPFDLANPLFKYGFGLGYGLTPPSKAAGR